MPAQSLPTDLPLHPARVHEWMDDASDGWGWAEVFILIQTLCGLALFVPGVQPFRTVLRALPYLSSAAALVYYFRRPTGEPLHPSAGWLVASLGLLVVCLMHPMTHSTAGIAQIVFQLTIAAPALWMTRAVRSEAKLDRLMWVLFGASAMSSLVGVLQVYFPETFLPPEFSGLGLSLNPELVNSLTYRGADGREIVRPPGLSDLPGGAAASAMMTVTLGVALAFRASSSFLMRSVALAAAATGMTTLLLTQVRSLTLVAVGTVAVFAIIKARQGKAAAGAASLALGALVAGGAFLWAATVGGDSLVERFTGLFDDGVVRTYQEQRGGFLSVTISELLFSYPLGAGLGRWGMMQVYFGDATMWAAPPIHVEIQPTGWLLDGGIPLWFLMAGAIIAALRASYLVAVHGTGSLQESAAVALCLQLAMLTICLTGPAFNTQLGIQFWALTAGLWGPVLAADDDAHDHQAGAAHA